MALQIPAGFAHASINYRFLEDLEEAMVTIGIDMTLWAGTDFAAADFTHDSWVTAWQTTTSNVVDITGVTLRVGTGAGDPLVFEHNEIDTGTVSFAMVPRNTAALVQKRTAIGGRRGRGRMFIPGVAREDQIDQAGNFLPTFTTFLTERIVAFRDAMAAGNLGLVLLHNDTEVVGYSSTTGKPVYGPIVPPAPTPITSLTVAPKAATQRRRMR
jgi:hypothetical protein